MKLLAYYVLLTKEATQRRTISNAKMLVPLVTVARHVSSHRSYSLNSLEGVFIYCRLLVGDKEDTRSLDNGSWDFVSGGYKPYTSLYSFFNLPFRFPFASPLDSPLVSQRLVYHYVALHKTLNPR